METIGKINTDGTIEKEFHVQGFVYKDFDAYTQNQEAICYVPEFTNEDDTENVYTPQDFLYLAEELFTTNEYEGDPQVLADMLFESVDWQCPETLLDEWDNMGEFDEYPESHGIEKL